jgi:hypothetical protein
MTTAISQKKDIAVISVASRARMARRRAQRLGLRLTQRGSVFRLYDADEVTLANGQLAAVEAHLRELYRPRPPGPTPRIAPPPGWGRLLDDYLLTLHAAGQRPATIRLRRGLLCRMARGLGCPPDHVTGEQLVNSSGRQQHWSPEARRSYRAAARGFFTWAYRLDRVPRHLSDELPKVPQPKAPPRGGV